MLQEQKGLGQYLSPSEQCWGPRKDHHASLCVVGYLRHRTK